MFNNTNQLSKIYKKWLNSKNGSGFQLSEVMMGPPCHMRYFMNGQSGPLLKTCGFNLWFTVKNDSKDLTWESFLVFLSFSFSFLGFIFLFIPWGISIFLYSFSQSLCQTTPIYACYLLHLSHSWSHFAYQPQAIKPVTALPGALYRMLHIIMCAKDYE